MGSAIPLSRRSPSPQALIQSAASKAQATISPWLTLQLQVLPVFLTVVVGAHLDSCFQLATFLAIRTATSVQISNLPRLACPMAAQQFLCSVALYSAWLACGANWVAK